ncbi:Putative aliphatic sulfonates transport permease protein SsuC [Pigmentiphaga humi]|uniref:Aliphatic sulfonates transport permease protein SsuC n=1 Tax=Pigmentiphaga humi TaxID=2478468 RepID=A0A3P4B2R0_9BURK|nr:ABC transporter permease [Pigmentiphaga humi]VCU70563.1 Putative aliphatic sulfonates transport permease protein SsuC [Pigmentiphaga humi]
MTRKDDGKPDAPDAAAHEIEYLEAASPARRLRIIRLCSIVFAFAMWEIFGRQIDPLFMSYPSAIGMAAYEMTMNGELPAAMSSSLQTLLFGFAIATVLGLVLGLVIGRYRAVEAATDWLVNALYATPLIAIIPLVILWFGLGNTSKLFIVVILTIFPVLINTISGVRNVPAALLDVGNAFAAREHQVFVKIILPSALPYMMTGVRLGIGRGIIGMVVAEFFTSITGLGALIVKYGNQFDTASMFVPIFVLMLMGVILTVLARRVESWIAPWRVWRED